MRFVANILSLASENRVVQADSVKPREGRKSRRYGRQTGASVWPFTSPLTDLLLCFLAIPSFWILGLEQVLPIPIIGFALIKVAVTRSKIRIPWAARIAFFFLLWQLVSATSIDVRTNWITFGKNFLSFVTAWCAFLVVVNGVKTPADFEKAILTLVLLSTIVTLIGTGFILGVLPGKFQALARDYLPSFLYRSEFVQRHVLQRRIGQPHAVLGNFEYRRVSSIFLYPFEAAIGYLIFIPLQLYLFKMSRGRMRLGLAVLILLSIVNFLSTATRTALFCFVFALCTVYLLHQLATLKVPRFTLPAAATLTVVITVAVIVPNREALVQFVNAFFVQIRATSFEARFAVYQVTIRSWLEHPLKGWGTQRKVPSLFLPAGTHSEYLGVLYRFGLVGLVAYFTFYTAIWTRLLRHIIRRRRYFGDQYFDRFYITAAGILFAVNLNGIAHGIDWDITVILLFWTVLGLIYAASGIESHHAQN